MARRYSPLAIIGMAMSCAALSYGIASGEAHAQKAPGRIFNTAKEKLREGKTIVGATVFSPDPNV